MNIKEESLLDVFTDIYKFQHKVNVEEINNLLKTEDEKIKKDEIVLVLKGNLISSVEILDGIVLLTLNRFIFAKDGEVFYSAPKEILKTYQLLDSKEPFQKMNDYFFVTIKSNSQRFFELKCESINEVEILMNEML